MQNYWPRSFEEIIFELRLEDQRHEVKSVKNDGVLRIAVSKRKIYCRKMPAFV